EHKKANYSAGEIATQEGAELTGFCDQFPTTDDDTRLGSCPGVDTTADAGSDYTGSRWFFTVSGQVFPNITVPDNNGQIWRITNPPGRLPSDLQLVDDTTQQPILMQLVAIDGASVDVPPINSGSAIRFRQIRAPSRFTPTPCPEAMTGGVLSSVPI